MSISLVPHSGAVPAHDSEPLRNWVSRSTGRRWTVPLLVACLAGFIGAAAYSQFLEHDRALWPRCSHDRNAHYSLGVDLALDARQGRVGEVLRHLHRSRVWGPLHGVLVAVPLAIFGPDYRLGVLPSLFGWIGTALFAFLLVRRVCRHGGTLGGLFGVLFVLGSPAHHAFATDIMLESMGACLTMVALYCYVRAVQERSASSVPLLGVALTALFIYKYNYWLLAVLAILAHELTSKLPLLRLQWQRVRSLPGWRRFLRDQMRHPVTYVLFVLTTMIVYVTVTGGGVIHVFGQRVSITAPPPPQNLVSITYVVFFVRVARLCIQHRAALSRILSPRQIQFLQWHVLPAAIWFLWPKRLAYFLWFISPANAGKEMGFLDGLPLYAHWLVRDYHAFPWVVPLVLALALFAIVAIRRWSEGGLIVVWFVLLAGLLTVQHPNQKSRFLHTTMPAVWVIAGVGAGQLPGRIRHQGSARHRTAGYALAGACLATVSVLHLPSMLEAAQAPDGGPKPDRPTTLEWAEGYLPDLADVRRPIIMSNQPIGHLLNWTYRTRFPERPAPELDIRRYGSAPDTDRQLFEDWLDRTTCDAIVYIHIPDDSRFHEFYDAPGHEQLRIMLEKQTVFENARVWSLENDSLTVTLWRRRGLDPADSRPASP